MANVPDHFQPAHYGEATLLVASGSEFFAGIQQGLDAQATDSHQMTVAYLFQVLLVDPMQFGALAHSQDRLIGYLIGRVDQLLHMQMITTPEDRRGRA